MSDTEKLVKTSVEESVTKAGVNSIFPSSIEDDISVLYYPSKSTAIHILYVMPIIADLELDDGEFNIWMVAMIAIGSLFLVFVGVTIFLIWYDK